MLDIFKIKLYWGSRKETVSECSKNLENLFDQLKVKDSFLTQWSLTGESKRKSLVSTFDTRNIESYLKANNSDLLDEQGYSKQGISMSLYKQDDLGNDYGLSFLGGYGGDLYPNNLIISFRDPSVFSKDEMLDLFETIIFCLKPEWGCIDSKNLIKQIGSSNNRIGWLSVLPQAFSKDLRSEITFKKVTDDFSVFYMRGENLFDYSKTNYISALKVFR